MIFRPWSASFFLVLLAGCSQANLPPSPLVELPSPIVVQTENSPIDEGRQVESAQPIPSKIETSSKIPSIPDASDYPIAKAREQNVVETTLVVKNRFTPTEWMAQRMAGFSRDGGYFIYMESSRDSGAGIPKAAMQLVEISSNQCIDRGCIETRYGEADARLDIADAENDLLQQTWKLRQALNLTPPAAGTSLPIVSRSRTSDGIETVTVRLNDRNSLLKLRLRQKQVGAMEKGNPQTAMMLEIDSNGQRRSLDSLNNFRPWVLDYSIREVHLSTNGKHLAILITATRPTFEGTLGTTLVQGFDLR